MKTCEIIILGTGGNCLEIVDMIGRLNSAKRTKFKVLGFLNDDRSKWRKTVRGVPVLGPMGKAGELRGVFFINGIHSPERWTVTEEVVKKLKINRERFVTLIDPTAVVDSGAKIGSGSVIFANVVVGAKARIGNHVMILPNSTIGHDCQIGDYSTIASGANVSGRVRVGRSCFLGTNSSIIQDITIGDRSMIGIGSVVLKDVPQRTVVAGNPAKVLRRI